ncbi:ferredoxin--NADP reductase [Thermophagus sp. OGC60D27]|uniref:ferredoxin--NADP reductase n=1 Tax=Thermophagus sp. OGC60D27 TaxID=3458415 RepID=UPI004037F6F4
MIKRKQKELFPVKVVSNSEIALGFFSLETERKFDFVPGQVVAVALNNHEEPRLYSIASGNGKEYLRLLFDVNPEGLLTPRMARLSKGDELFMSEPFGRFLGSSDPAWWIATGTGIAPFISMAESGMAINKKLIHGAKTPGEFLFADMFIRKMGDNYLRFATRESGPGIYRGRLTHWLKEATNLPKEIKYFLCGNANMVVEVRDILVRKGVEIDHVIAEIYF